MIQIMKFTTMKHINKTTDVNFFVKQWCLTIVKIDIIIIKNYIFTCRSIIYEN